MKLHLIFCAIAAGVISFASHADDAPTEELDVVGYYIPNEQKETTQISNILSFEEMSRSGDSNAGDALSRISGISLGNDNAVIVRGLDDRYSQTLMDGSVLPSPEPNKRVAPLELFPTNFMESILVQKTYSPQYPGEYAGGLIELRSKTLPDLPFWSVGVSTGYIAGSTFEDGNTYEGGGLDWLATDDGSRDVPDYYQDLIDAGKVIAPLVAFVEPNGLTDEEFEALAKSFDRTGYGIESQTNLPEMGVSASFGNRWDIGLNSYGLVGSLSYDAATENRDEERATYDAGGNTYQEYDYHTTQKTIDINALLSGGVELGFDNSLKTTFMYIKNATDTVAVKEGDILGEDANDEETRLEWVERTVISSQIEGDHYLPITDTSRFTWLANYATGQRYAPDTRSYMYSDREDGETSLQLVQGNSVNSRDYSEVSDTKLNLNGEIKFPFYNGIREGQLFAGVNYIDQNQDSSIYRFRYTSDADYDYLTDDIDEIITDERIDSGEIQIEDNTQVSDNWYAEKTILSTYGQAEVPLGARFSFTAGSRFESVSQKVFTPESQNTDGSYNYEVGALDDLDILPVVTATYQLTESIQVRGAYSRTVARPSFREMSESEYYDVETGQPFRGNADLVTSTIDNFDTRLEWYGQTGDSWSVGAFYKTFTDPLERTVAPSVDEYITIINSDSATNYGVEFEVEQYLNFLSDRLSNYFWNANLTFIESEIDLGEDAGMVTNSSRPMQGQSDILFNTQFGYENINTGRSAVFSYNYTGDRIDQIGVDGKADIIDNGYGALDFNFSTVLPNDRSIKLGFKAQNILATRREFTQDGLVTRSYNEPFKFSISLTKSWEDIPVDIYADD